MNKYREVGDIHMPKTEIGTILTYIAVALAIIVAIWFMLMKSKVIFAETFATDVVYEKPTWEESTVTTTSATTTTEETEETEEEDEDEEDEDDE